MSEAFTYSTATAPQTAFTGSMKMIDGFVGRVVRSDGKVVWTSGVYGNARAARLQANAQLRPLRDYLSTTGHCWYDDQVAKRDALKSARLHRRAVNARLTTAITAGINCRLQGLTVTDYPPGYSATQKLAFEAAWTEAAELPPETPILP